MGWREKRKMTKSNFRSRIVLRYLTITALLGFSSKLSVQRGARIKALLIAKSSERGLCVIIVKKGYSKGRRILCLEKQERMFVWMLQPYHTCTQTRHTQVIREEWRDLFNFSVQSKVHTHCLKCLSKKILYKVHIYLHTSMLTATKHIIKPKGTFSLTMIVIQYPSPNKVIHLKVVVLCVVEQVHALMLLLL